MIIKKKAVLKTVLIALVVICLIAIVSLVIHNMHEVKQAMKESEQSADESVSAELANIQDVSINLGYGMHITAVGRYMGIYMEDGSDEFVSDVMMIVVENEGDEAIQYAKISIPVGDSDACFSMSTLTPGSSMVLLEQNRMAYTPDEYTTAVAENVVIFQESLSLCEDKLEIRVLDGAMNVTNISGQDISGNITIYYKNSAVDAYYGGITYRVHVKDGLKKDEIRQVTAGHLSESGSTIMFVTIGETA